MLTNQNYTLTNFIKDLFPDQIRVFDVSHIENITEPPAHLIHQHFNELLSPQQEQQLAEEITCFLFSQKEGTTYAYFHRSLLNEYEHQWHISVCRLHKTTGGNPKEIVRFTYDLELFPHVKERLYNVLDNAIFIKRI